MSTVVVRGERSARANRSCGRVAPLVEKKNLGVYCGAGKANVVHGRAHTNVEVKASLPYSPRESEELRAKYRSSETTPESLAPSANVTTGAAVLGQSFSGLASTSNPPKRAATNTAAGGTFAGYWRSGRAIERTRSFVSFVKAPCARDISASYVVIKLILY